jgi:polyphosphate glucokinase
MPVKSVSKKKTIKKTTGNVLTIDIGGSNIKGTVLDNKGKIIEPYKKEPTPLPATPAAVIATIKNLVSQFTAFDKISVGFPGYVKEGVVHTAPNLGKGWAKTDLAKKLSATFKKPVRIVNDADLQGLGVAKGNGFEIVITLGTGFGTAFLMNGKLLPHMELAHHPLNGKRDYDDYIGEAKLLKIGKKEWKKRIRKVLGILLTVFNYDHLYISGGNAGLITFQLAKNISIVSNKDGIKGGARLWNDSIHV